MFSGNHNQKQDIAIYIHWPYCLSKCPYCDFYKEIKRDLDDKVVVDEYIESLKKYRDITSYKNVKSIFFGGGTPSLMSPRQIERIIDFIAKNWHFNSDIEISLEANPNTHNSKMFKQLKEAGINRISLGIQALNEQNLKFLGRTHNLEIARQCLNEVVRVFSNHSADLIYALPEQNSAMWLAQLREICSYGLKHISLYQLTIEEGTVFAKKGIKPLNENVANELYILTNDFLQTNGYSHYEVSNFAQPGYESIHNLTYWQGGDYIGIGKSAHGRLLLNGEYTATEYPFIHEKLTPQQRAEELLIMGLRLFKGIDKNIFEENCSIKFDEFINVQKAAELVEAGYLINDENTLRPTLSGMLILNRIILELCC